MTRFFIRPNQIQGGLVTLDAEDAHHLRVVLHAAPGQKISVLDGLGLEYSALLLELGKTRAVAQLSAPFSPNTEPRTQITIAQALPKVAEKMEQVFQRGTEIGAVGFRAFQSERSLTQLTGERQAKRMIRWSAIIKTAAEQSHRALLPTLEVVGEFSDILASVKEYDLALMAHEGETDATLHSVLGNSSAPPTRIIILIGPESGFSDSEVKAARRGGVTPISLGSRILRTETAALVVLSQLLFALEPHSVR